MLASKSGYAYSMFVLPKPDDDLRCLICLGVARDALQHEECGRLFCKCCIEEYGKEKPCPHCRDQKSSYYINKRGRRAIRALKVKCSNSERCEWEGTLEALEKHEAMCIKVKCSNSERGCEWEGTLEALEKHEATCEFTPLPCSKECKDDSNNITRVMRKDLADHLVRECPQRDHQCKHCGEKGTYADITQIHDERCAKKPVSCPECKETMLQGTKRKHLDEECEVVDLPCKYMQLGCGVKMKRRDLAAHEWDNKQLHLDMAMNMMRKQTMTFKFTEYQRKKDRNDCFSSPSFYTSSTGYRVGVRVWANGRSEGRGTHVSVYMNVLGGEHDSKLHWPFLGSLTFTLLNQLEDNNHHSKTVTITSDDRQPVRGDEGYADFISHSELGYNPVRNTQYLKDDTLYFRVEVEVANRMEVDDNKPWLK